MSWHQDGRDDPGEKDAPRGKDAPGEKDAPGRKRMLQWEGCSRWEKDAPGGKDAQPWDTLSTPSWLSCCKGRAVTVCFGVVMMQSEFCLILTPR